jgi:Tfp pilus assembly protein FimT
MTRLRKARAFTVVELVTVVVILGILSIASAGPVLTYMTSVRGGAAASRLSSDLRYMQRLALSSGLRTWVVFSTSSQTYQLYIENRDNPGKANRVVVSHPVDQSTSAIAFNTGPFAGVTMTSVNINSAAELEFDSFGRPYDSASVALTAAGQVVLSSGGTVVIRPVTGLVEIQ